MRKRLWYGLFLGLGAAAVALALWLGGALETWENGTWAMRVRRMAKPSPATAKIKLIMLDQPSLDWGKKEMGLPWPWPREVLGPILEFCQRGGAKAVAFDVMYTEPSASGEADDQAFGAAIQHGVPFVAAVFAGGENSEFTAWPEGVPAHAPVFHGLEALPRTTAQSASFPVPIIASSAAMLANVSSLPDADGVYRRSGLFRVFDGKVLPSLGFGAYLADRARIGKPAEVSVESRWLNVDGARIPIDEQGRTLVRFLGPSGTHQTFGAAEIIRSELLIREGKAPQVDPAALKDCYVFFGYNAPGLFDLQPTPVDRKYPGVEIHATMLDNLLERSFLREAPRSLVIPSMVVLCLLSGIAGILSRKAWHTVLGFLVFLAVPFGLGFAAYARGFWWPIMVGEAGAGLSLVGAVVVNYATEGRQKAFLKNAFRYYLGAEVIEQIIADPSRLTLGGERRELTIFFSDIEKFSSFSERLDPPTLTALLNDYLSDMSAIIQQEGGYLDKYIGDAIVAFWNAPLDQPDHAVRACRAAVRCARKLAERRPEFEQRTGAVVKARVGLNTGAVAVGNMGSYERFNYTILGDAANLASRLEGANKAFGTYALISETTWEATGGQFVGRELGRLRVVGRKAPVKVYELAGLPGEPRPPHFEPFEKALAVFYEGDFREALVQFEQLSGDPAARSYAAQCRDLLEHPPTEWDGVLSLTEK